MRTATRATATTADDYYKVAKAYAMKLIKLKDRTLNTNFKEIFDNEINGCNPANGDVLFEMGFVPNSGGDIGWCHGLSVDAGSKGAGTTYTNLTPKLCLLIRHAGPASARHLRQLPLAELTTSRLL